MILNACQDLARKPDSRALARLERSGDSSYSEGMSDFAGLQRSKAIAFRQDSYSASSGYSGRSYSSDYPKKGSGDASKAVGAAMEKQLAYQKEQDQKAELKRFWDTRNAQIDKDAESSKIYIHDATVSQKKSQSGSSQVPQSVKNPPKSQVHATPKSNTTSSSESNSFLRPITSIFQNSSDQAPTTRIPPETPSTNYRPSGYDVGLISADTDEQGNWYLSNSGKMKSNVEYRIKSKHSEDWWDVEIVVQGKQEISLAPLNKRDVMIIILYAH
ncbi:MAG: hypothetical protein QM680_09155 [Luteolibacter sp.]